MNRAADITTELLFAIRDEAARGRMTHGPHHSAHEAWAILHEECDELWDEVRKKCPSDEALAMEASRWQRWPCVFSRMSAPKR